MSRPTSRRGFLLGAVAAPFLAQRSMAQAQFPSRPIRIVIGFPPGGGIDILARLMAPKMSERLGQPVVVENRPGANGLIATQGVAQSDPDGHTILFGTTGNLAVNPALYPGKPGMAMERDFTALSHVASLDFLLVVNPAVPANSLNELVELIKAKPGQIFFGSSGNGGLPHLSGELLNIRAGIARRSRALSGQRAGLYRPDQRAGAIRLRRACHRATARRVPKGARHRYNRAGADDRAAGRACRQGDAAGLRGGELVRHGDACRHAAEIVARLSEEVKNALNQPDVAERAAGLGLNLVGSTPDQFATFQRAEIAKWGEIVRTANIKIE